MGGLAGVFSGNRPATYGGMNVIIRDAQQQARTARDVPGPWIIPGRVPSKRAGRRGTRRAWKRAHPPHRAWLYREPEDALVIGQRTLIATPAQADALRRMTEKRE